jgi:hypothetical protein
VAIDIIASEGVFEAESEAPLMRGVFDALLRTIDATGDPQVSAVLGIALHVVPAGRAMMGGIAATSVRIDVVLPGIALASFRRRRRFIAEATAAVSAHSRDPGIRPRIVVRIMHCLDGGWGVGGHAFTNDEIDEGSPPEA